METIERSMFAIEHLLNRHVARNRCSSHSLLAANYIASVRCYRGENYKKCIRLGRRILDHHLRWETTDES